MVKITIWLGGFLAAVFFLVPLPVQALTASEILVVSNRAVPTSDGLARYYMERRQIPASNRLVLKTSVEEQISRAEYEKQIAGPLRQFIQQQDPDGSRFKCLVLMFGLPLRVLPPPQTAAEREEQSDAQKRLALLDESLTKLDNEQRLQTKALQEEAEEIRRLLKHRRQFHKGASVDSELALVMEADYPLQGWLPNPFFLGYRNQQIDNLPERVVMVSRLDGPTEEIVRRIIDDSIATEKVGLAGKAYFDARWPAPEKEFTSAYGRYDAALHNTARRVEQSGLIPVVLNDVQALFQPGEAPDAALYAGWYSLGKYVDAFTWSKGAVGYHVASAECTTLKNKTDQGWCKAMLERGVVATLGPVAEPYLQAFPAPEIFFGCLLVGRNPLAECFALANPFWSWQMVLIGDPLYRPCMGRP